MEKKSEKGTIALILGFIKRMQEDHIGAYAAQTAYSVSYTHLTLPTKA